MRRVAVLVLLFVAAGCERPDGGARALDRSKIAVRAEPTIRTDDVGVDRFASKATFVLVDADNLGEVDADVTLGGVLVDADGREVGQLRAESLRIPARGRRTFALVDRERVERKTAVGARIDVRGAQEPRFLEPVKITDGHVYRDGDRVVVAGMVRNPSDRACVAMVLAGFHDKDGRPLARPFSAFELGGGAARPTRFVGPPGSTTGYIFVGDIVFCPRSGCDVERRTEKLW
jgi:hypothetical protein